MGVVYSAYDDRLGRPVAIKMIKAAVAEPAARDRLRREARSAASVNHPRSASCTRSARRTASCSSRWSCCRGSRSRRGSRAGACRSAKRSRPRSVLTGLDALHRQGLVHRDLKPSNIFLTPHGVKLLDFGLTPSIEAAGGRDGMRRDAARHGHRDAAVRGARAARGESGRRAHRSVRGRRGALRDAGGQAAVRRAHGDRGVPRHHVRPAARADGRSGGRGARPRRPPGAREAAGRPLSVGRGDGAGSARGAGARRRGRRHAGPRR